MLKKNLLFLSLTHSFKTLLEKTDYLNKFNSEQIQHYYVLSCIELRSNLLSYAPSDALVG